MTPLTDRHEPTSLSTRCAAALIVIEGVAAAFLLSSGAPSGWAVVRIAVAGVLTFAAATVSTRRPTRSGRAAVIAFGLAGVVLALGIGVPWLVQAGPSVIAVAGLVAAATGITTTAHEAISCLRGGTRVTKILAVPVAGAVLIGIVFPVTLAVFVTNVPPLRPGEDDPSDRGMQFVDVTLTLHDGVELGGWYVPSSNGSVVVLLGGATSVRSDELDHAAVLARHGYGVLLVDGRGHGVSDGDAMLWGWFGDDEVSAALDYLESRADVAPGRVAVMGMSMGAEEAIGAAGRDSRIAAVVAEGASARGPRDEGDPAEGVGGLLTRYIDWVAIHTADLMTDAHAPRSLRDAITLAAPRPFLIIAAGTRPAEIAAADAFDASSPSNVDIWIAPNADHTKAYDTSPTEWERRVISFLDRALTP